MGPTGSRRLRVLLSLPSMPSQDTFFPVGDANKKKTKRREKKKREKKTAPTALPGNHKLHLLCEPIYCFVLISNPPGGQRIGRDLLAHPVVHHAKHRARMELGPS